MEKALRELRDEALELLSASILNSLKARAELLDQARMFVRDSRLSAGQAAAVARFDRFVEEVSRKEKTNGLLDILATVRRIQREFPGHIRDAFDSFRLEAVRFIRLDIDELDKQRPHKPYTGRLIPVAFAMCAFGLTLVLGFGGVFGKAEGPDSPLNFVHLLLTLGSPFIGAYVGEALIKSRERSYDDLRSSLEARVSDLRSRQGNWMQMNCPAQLTLVPDLLAQWRVS